MSALCLALNRAVAPLPVYAHPVKAGDVLPESYIGYEAQVLKGGRLGQHMLPHAGSCAIEDRNICSE